MLATVTQFFGPFWLLLPVLCVVAIGSWLVAARLGARREDMAGLAALMVFATIGVWLPLKVFVAAVPRFGSVYALTALAVLAVIVLVGVLTARSARARRQPHLVIWRRSATAVLISSVAVDSVAIVGAAVFIWSLINPS